LKAVAAREGHDELAQRVRQIDDLASRMDATIKTLKRFARPSEGRRDAIDLGAVIANSRLLLDARLEEADMVLRVRPDVANAYVLGDQILLEQVTLNLMANAIDAIEERRATDRSLRGHITIRVHQENEYSELHVEDNGVGLRRLPSKRAFDPFFTTKE